MHRDVLGEGKKPREVYPERVAAERNGGPPLPGNHSPLFAPVPKPTIQTGVTAMTLAVLSAFDQRGPTGSNGKARHCERSEAIHDCPERQSGLLHRCRSSHTMLRDGPKTK
jgi:hypothetical protein